MHTKSYHRLQKHIAAVVALSLLLTLLYGVYGRESAHAQIGNETIPLPNEDDAVNDFQSNLPDEFDPDLLDALPGFVSLFTLPFGGRLLDTDYLTCSCGSVVLTIQDTRTGLPIRIVYIYALDLLKKFGVIPNEIPTPTLYMFYNVFTPGVQHLGRFVPVPGAPCLVTIPVPPYCSVTTSGGVGYLYNLGTSLIPF